MTNYGCIEVIINCVARPKMLKTLEDVWHIFGWEGEEYNEIKQIITKAIEEEGRFPYLTTTDGKPVRLEAIPVEYTLDEFVETFQ